MLPLAFKHPKTEFDRCQDGHSSSNVSGQAGPHNVFMTVYHQSSFAMNCQWSESRAWNISVHQEMYSMSNRFQVWMTLTTAGEFLQALPYQILKDSRKKSHTRACGEPEQRPAYWQNRFCWINRENQVPTWTRELFQLNTSKSAVGACKREREGSPLFRLFVKIFFKNAINVGQLLQEEKAYMTVSVNNISCFLFTRGVCWR